jgi:hypothetical protein
MVLILLLKTRCLIIVRCQNQACPPNRRMLWCVPAAQKAHFYVTELLLLHCCR